MGVVLHAASDPANTGRSKGERMPLVNLLMVCGGIYTAQGIIGGLTFQGLPAALRANDVALDKIGLVYLAMLPWALKFLWAPSLERVRIRTDNSRRSRPIVLSGQLVCIVLLFALAMSGVANFYLLLGLVFSLALVAATVDIACDGFIIEQLSRENRGWGNTAQMGGAYAGFVIGGGLFLWVVGAHGWTVGLLSLAVFLLVLMLPFVFLAEPQPNPIEHAHRPSLRFALARPEVRVGIFALVLFDVGIRVTSGLGSPFLVDSGMSLKLIGLLAGFGGAAAGILGTIAGGLIVRKVGASRATVVAIMLQVCIVGAFFLVSITQTTNINVLAALIVSKSVVMGIGFVSIYSLAMGLASSRQAGVDFTLFQSVDAAVAAIGGFGAGMLAESFGYAGAFGFAGVVSATAAVVIPAFLLKRLNMSHEVERAS